MVRDMSNASLTYLGKYPRHCRYKRRSFESARCCGELHWYEINYVYSFRYGQFVVWPLAQGVFTSCTGTRGNSHSPAGLRKNSITPTRDFSSLIYQKTQHRSVFSNPLTFSARSNATGASPSTCHLLPRLGCAEVSPCR